MPWWFWVLVIFLSPSVLLVLWFLWVARHRIFEHRNKHDLSLRQDDYHTLLRIGKDK